MPIQVHQYVQDRPKQHTKVVTLNIQLYNQLKQKLNQLEIHSQSQINNFNILQNYSKTLTKSQATNQIAKNEQQNKSQKKGSTKQEDIKQQIELKQKKLKLKDFENYQVVRSNLQNMQQDYYQIYESTCLQLKQDDLLYNNQLNSTNNCVINLFNYAQINNYINKNFNQDSQTNDQIKQIMIQLQNNFHFIFFGVGQFAQLAEQLEQCINKSQIDGEEINFFYFVNEGQDQQIVTYKQFIRQLQFFQNRCRSGHCFLLIDDVNNKFEFVQMYQCFNILYNDQTYADLKDYVHIVIFKQFTNNIDYQSLNKLKNQFSEVICLHFSTHDLKINNNDNNLIHLQQLQQTGNCENFSQLFKQLIQHVSNQQHLDVVKQYLQVLYLTQQQLQIDVNKVLVTVNQIQVKIKQSYKQYQLITSDNIIKSMKLFQSAETSQGTIMLIEFNNQEYQFNGEVEDLEEILKFME